MRAAVARRLGPPAVLVAEELPDPQAGPGQVLIDVEYASVTFVETQVRAGRPPNPAMVPALPLIPGNGVGGRVTGVGSGVDEANIGRRVVSVTGGRGGYADRVVVEQAAPIDIPDGLSTADATALLADGRTALALIAQAEVRAGQTVLVEAAAGGVGSCLVQLALGAGARVIGCVGSEDKQAAVTGLGAEAALVYTRPGWVEQARATVGQVDVVFDGVGGDIGAGAVRLLRPGGLILSYGMAGGAFTELGDREQHGQITVVRGLSLAAQRMRDLSAQALRLAAAGQLRPLIGQVRALDDAADAHAAIEARSVIGKTLLRTASADARDGEGA